MESSLKNILSGVCLNPSVVMCVCVFRSAKKRKLAETKSAASQETKHSRVMNTARPKIEETKKEVSDKKGWPFFLSVYCNTHTYAILDDEKTRFERLHVMLAADGIIAFLMAVLHDENVGATPGISEFVGPLHISELRPEFVNNIGLSGGRVYFKFINGARFLDNAAHDGWILYNPERAASVVEGNSTGVSEATNKAFMDVLHASFTPASPLYDEDDEDRLLPYSPRCKKRFAADRKKREQRVSGKAALDAKSVDSFVASMIADGIIGFAWAVMTDDDNERSEILEFTGPCSVHRFGQFLQNVADDDNIVYVMFLSCGTSWTDYTPDQGGFVCLTASDGTTEDTGDCGMSLHGMALLDSLYKSVVGHAKQTPAEEAL